MATLEPTTPLDELEISYISEQLGPFDWRKLGLYLGIPENRLSNWERQHMMNTEQAASQMLFTWHNNQHPNKERGHLIEALEKCKLRSLGEKVRSGECRRTLPQGMRPVPPETYNHPPPRQYQPPAPPPAQEPIATCTYTPPPNHPQQPQEAPRMRVQHQYSHEITEIKLRDLSQRLGSEWRMVGTYLGFDNSAIQVLQEQYQNVKETIFQMLLEWRNTRGIQATKEKLKKVLKQSGRDDLTDFVDEPDD